MNIPNNFHIHYKASNKFKWYSRFFQKLIIHSNKHANWHIKPYQRFVFLLQCSNPLQLKKKKAKLTKLVGRCMFQTTNHLSDQTTKHILSFYFRIEFVKIGIYTHVFIMNKYLRYNQEWIFPAEITKKKKPTKYINKNNSITSKTFNYLGFKQNLTFWWCRGLSIA